MGFENCKNAAQFPFMQPKNTSLVSNTIPFTNFGLNLLATGCIEQTIRISVVMRLVNFSFFITTNFAKHSIQDKGIVSRQLKFKTVNISQNVG